MSEATKAALDEAITAHLQDECAEGVLLTAYTMLTSYVSAGGLENSTTGYFAEYSEDIAHHVARGLVHQHLRRLDHELLFQAEGDDDE